jgi:hypothetical protein
MYDDVSSFSYQKAMIERRSYRSNTKDDLQYSGEPLKLLNKPSTCHGYRGQLNKTSFTSISVISFGLGSSSVSSAIWKTESLD